MSGSYWTSTQRLKWQYTKEELAKERQGLWALESQLFPHGLNIILDSKQGSNDYPVARNIPISHRDLHYDKDYNLRIYCYFLVMKLGRRLNIRQCALATAQIYLSRFLLKVSIREINLYLLVTTCVYLACKVEECPRYIRTLVSEARSLWPEFVPPDPTKVTEFEFYMIEELKSFLIVHHPYNSMEQVVEALRNDRYQLSLSQDDIQNCWSLINDTYISDVHLIYPPHIIAIACLFITVCIRGKQITRSPLTNLNSPTPDMQNNQEIFNRFMAESLVDLDQVMDTIQELIILYDHWDKYHEPWIKFLLHTLYLRSSNQQASTAQIQN